MLCQGLSEMIILYSDTSLMVEKINKKREIEIEREKGSKNAGRRSV